MVQESLLNYIRTQVSSGQRLDHIFSILLQQGFSQKQIDEAYAQLGYLNSIQQTTPSAPIQTTQKKFFPVIIIVLALFILLILGTLVFSNKNKSTLVSSHTTFITSPTTSKITPATQSLSACSLPTRWTSTVGTSFNATAYLKPVSMNVCEYTDSLLGYIVQYPANWYILFTPATSNGVTGNNGMAQSYNVISFDSQQLSASNSSPLAVSISITPSKTNYTDIISYMESIQKGPPVKSYEPLVEKNVYQPVSVDGQRAIQMQYTLGDSVGIDTKFISNGVLYDISFNGTSPDAINANKQYYKNLLNSFAL